MNKLSILALFGVFLVSGISGQNSETQGEVQMFGFLKTLANIDALSLAFKSNETINNNDNKNFTLPSMSQTLAEVDQTPTIPSTDYEPSLHWSLIVFITLMSITLVVVGGMMALRQAILAKTNNNVIKDVRENRLIVRDDDDE